MCGFIANVANDRIGNPPAGLLDVIAHRGPDDQGTFASPAGRCWLGHRRLSILDLSDAGRQPLMSHDGRYALVFNGEIYNYLELRDVLGASAFRTGTDTEVLLAAWMRWGEGCLHRLVGMFAFAVWDEREQTLFAARDRFGVKPLFVHESAAGEVWLASEVKALHAAGVRREPDRATWATYLSAGLYDHDEHTFWDQIRSVRPGHQLTWRPGERPTMTRWYDPAAAVLAQGPDQRSDAEVADELLALLETTVQLRFRADVPVGLCLSGGLDSSLLLALVRRVRSSEPVKTFTFYCGDPRYDETPWVEQMLAGGLNPSFLCRLDATEVPALAARVTTAQDEPFGGIPTLGMAKVHERARAEGVTGLLDGNGVDEAWAGYDYYARAAGAPAGAGPVQGTKAPATRADCVTPELALLARPFTPPCPFDDPLANLQLRDLMFTKIPRAMRFADRVSMMFSRELREPFLDHRLVELGLRQPRSRKIRDGQGKWLPRQIAAQLLPGGVVLAPKRPVQTPQREWLRGPLAQWATGRIEDALAGWGRDWLDPGRVRVAWREYQALGGDNSFPIWQWISLGMAQANRSPGDVPVPPPSSEARRSHPPPRVPRA